MWLLAATQQPGLLPCVCWESTLPFLKVGEQCVCHKCTVHVPAAHQHAVMCLKTTQLLCVVNASRLLPHAHCTPAGLGYAATLALLWQMSGGTGPVPSHAIRSSCLATALTVHRRFFVRSCFRSCRSIGNALEACTCSCRWACPVDKHGTSAYRYVEPSCALRCRRSNWQRLLRYKVYHPGL